MDSYYIWNEGCQMNVADAQRLASALEKLGLHPAPTARQASLVVLNTCVVRQSAEDKAANYLHALRPLKAAQPELVIGVMGCMVGLKPNEQLEARFPWVDVFMPPSTPAPLLAFLHDRLGLDLDQAETARRFAVQDGELVLPAAQRGQLVSAYVPIVLGCSHACSFCVIPFRRGVERSRPLVEIVAEVRSLVPQGVKEVTLLGQIVDRYGQDINCQLLTAASADVATLRGKQTPLVGLLEELELVEGLERIRFLTSHPNWMTDELLEAVARLPKVCEHIEVPVQAGDDEVLARMKRAYTAGDYRRLIEKIRCLIPGASIATDIIVGFPGESQAQFQRTCELLAELKLDVAHIAKYSPRPQTVSARTMQDDVPPKEKERRRKALDELQAGIVGEINARLVGQSVEVLVEDKQKGRWRGRTRTNKLVFFEDERDWRGQLAHVTITWAGPWSLIGQVD
ncbi:MAG: MiaB/RimO family radical SAM methylthiotransferase [Thermoflexales bacterium]|nr:MiaB/RimO family radical SAM methylthiotransferase [Thermoflexales bacterium]